ncbi:hypothetical protein I553_3751 [Mycobacterium xenopi 4042]|uniref:Uncharacterized protein n=1 Tax=Mycobacterium xenopi 4042 TaxID=1299334 RepID=X7YR13_MYCXE|nr:hypothetical protein I553_3751 [Mycobacterium xenopi 4042]
MAELRVDPAEVGPRLAAAFSAAAAALAAPPRSHRPAGGIGSCFGSGR